MKKTSPKQKRLVLLDAHAIIHRAYHALPDFSSSKGEPTGALYGLSAMLIKIIKDFEPDYIAACYDLPGKTHRHDVFEEYKAGRQQADDALVAQLQSSRDIFKAFNIPIFEAPGFEADDVLGTIVSQLKKQKHLEIIIASGDHDTLQLVSGERVQMFTMRKGLNDTVMFTEDAIQARYGFGPDLIPDYKGLRGDPSDNIPGVKGVGEKTATDLIRTFGSMENIYKTLKKNPNAFEEQGFKPRVVQLLTDGEDMAAFSKMIATISTDAPIQFTLPKEPWALSRGGHELFDMFDALEFRTLKERAKSIVTGDTQTEEGDDEEQQEQQEIDEQVFKETAVALWILNSDTTMPELDDILRFTGAEQFEAARKNIFAELKKIPTLAKVYKRIEEPLIEVTERMQEQGVLLDVAYLKKLSTSYHKKLDAIHKRIIKHAGRDFNVRSPKQLAEILFDELGLQPEKQKRTGTGQRSTKESELEKIKDQHPIVEDVLAYRELQKLLSTYIDVLPTLVGDDGRLHAAFMQTGTTTGRMSSINPNLQNIPIRSEYGHAIRDAFIAEKGYALVRLDYSQIELRIAAGLSGDKKLVTIFKEGGDVHESVAAEVFEVAPKEVTSEMRRRAKIINFGILYGMGVNALKVALGGETTRNDAQTFLNAYFENFSGLAEYIEHTKQDAARQGFTETLFGRRRYFAGFKSHLPFVRAQAERMAINAPIQGTQADIIKIAMGDVHAQLKKEKAVDDVRLVLQVHDELVYEIRESETKKWAARIQAAMESVVAPAKLHGVPLVVDVETGPNWGNMNPLT